MFVPSVHDFKSCREFFADFFAKNTRTTRGFSHRQVAKRLGWPTSLLADVVAGRKQLSMLRAIEFGTYFKLVPYDIDYLITLACAELPEESVRGYFKRKLAGELSESRYTLVLEPVADESVKSIVVLIAQMHVARSVPLELQAVRRALIVADRLDDALVESMIRLVIENKLVRYEKDKGILDVGAVHRFCCDKVPMRGLDRVQSHAIDRASVQNVECVSASMTGLISESAFEDIRAKVISLRNQLVMLNRHAVAPDRPPGHAVKAFQFHWDFFRTR